MDELTPEDIEAAVAWIRALGARQDVPDLDGDVDTSQGCDRHWRPRARRYRQPTDHNRHRPRRCRR